MDVARRSAIQRAITSVDFLFGELSPADGKLNYPEFWRYFRQAGNALQEEATDAFIAAVNAMCRNIATEAGSWEKEQIHSCLERQFFERLQEFRIFLPAEDSAVAWEIPRKFFLHWCRILQGLIALEGYRKMLSEEDFWPGAGDLFSPELPPDVQSQQYWQKRARRHDPFASHNVARYIEGHFEALDFTLERSRDAFYGYSAERQIFTGYFEAFAAGQKQPPLLISSLPGLGKTQLTMANTLACDNLTLILAGPDALEGNLEQLLQALSQRSDRKFVVFFDDIDPKGIDWYHFRTLVGGSYSLASHITLVLASNYPFPASVLSRGRSITFPIFDEVRCQEMIADYLSGRGMRQIHNNLVSVIAADYTDSFAQKEFTELSPRTLMRYLARYDQSSEKRMRMLELARAELILRPDAQIFYEFNIQLQRTLYGDEYIEKLLQEKLHKLSTGQ